MVSQETTQDWWAFDEPLFAQRRGFQEVPEHFLKNARWSKAEGGYITNSKAGRIIKVEFSFNHLCWAETCWSHNDNQWEIFRPALSDLGCDIYISELTIEEIHRLDEDKREDTHTTHTRTPAPSTASKGSEIAEEPERIVIHKAPRSGEQELAKLAESLHISAHPIPTIMTTQTQTVPVGIIDPATGRMMMNNKVALHRAIGPDQNDLPGGSPARGPFGGGRPPQGPPGGGFPGGGPPTGLPGGGHGHQNGGARGSDKLVGNPPEIFMGIRTKAEPVLTFWGIYTGVNRECSIIANPYQKCLLFLTYIQGNNMAKWVQEMSRWLQRQVDQEGVDSRDPWLYNSTITFCRKKKQGPSS